MNLLTLVEAQDAMIAKGELWPVQDFEKRRFAFLIEIDASGKCLGVTDLRGAPKTPEATGKLYDAPIIDRTRKPVANLLWDNRDYVLGIPKDNTTKQINNAKERFGVFQHSVEDIRAHVASQGEHFFCLDAISQFYKRPAKLMRERDYQIIRDADPSLRISFRLEGTPYPVFLTPGLDKYLVRSRLYPTPTRIGQCLVTGETGPLGDLHGRIKGVVRAQETGAYLVSFNQKAFDSHGIQGSANAPMLERVTRGYHRFLNVLLMDRLYHIPIGDGNHAGDGSILIWDSTMNGPSIPQVIGTSMMEAVDRENTVQNFRILRDKVIEQGMQPSEVGGKVYTLEMKANSARLAVTFWREDDATTVYKNIVKWFDDMHVTLPKPPPGWPEPMTRYISLYDLLSAMTALSEDQLRLIKESLVRSAISGSPIAATVLPAVLHAFKRSNQEHRGSFVLDLHQYRLTALIELILSRSTGEQPVSLDRTKKDRAYNLGRLFALYEKAQEEAISGLTGGIMNRIGNAMEMPGTEFPSLFKLNTKHMRELSDGTRIWLSKQIAEVFSNLGDSFTDLVYPKTLSNPEQGNFTLGYWEQKTALYAPKAKASGTTATTTATTTQEIEHEDA